MSNVFGKILYSIIFSVIIIVSFSFTDSPPPPPSGWYKQSMPIGNRRLNDITFIDSLTGYAVTSSNNDTSYFLKTTNGGNNWQIIYRQYYYSMTKLQFLDEKTGFAGGFHVYKTTNGGYNWSSISNSLAVSAEDISVLNQDTIWMTSYVGSGLGWVFRTTNGGTDWDVQYTGDVHHIYMFNPRIGFTDGDGFKKTTNGGASWIGIANEGTFFDMFFADSLTGWKCNGFVKKTTNGGLNWFYQTLPSGNFLGQGVVRFMNADNDTIWAVGETLITGGTPPSRGILFRTTNAGNNWLFQLPDTSIHIVGYWLGKMINNKYGWAYHFYQGGIHTTTGGDTIWYIGINKISNNVPVGFTLKQNYPNPFNPCTIIPYSIKSSAHIKLIAYDILGKEVLRMVDQYQQPGEYEVDFMGKFSSTGVYFYRLIADDKAVDTKKMILLK